MEQKYVGNSGLGVSVVGLGCNNFGWRIDKETARPIVHAALDRGITLFDTADCYGEVFGASEEALGEIIQGKRDQLIITTKFGVPEANRFGITRNNSRAYVIKALEASLKRLRTDRIDVYMLHWPDHHTPIAETLRALDDLVTAGKIRYIACSNLPSWRIGDAHWVAKELSSHRFIATQDHYNLLYRKAEKDLLPALAHYRMGLIPYYPLAGGMLTGKYLGNGKGRLSANWIGLGDRFLTERNQEIVRRLDAYARERGRNMLELAVSWLACQPLIPCVIAGATTVEQVKNNVKAASWKMTPQEIIEIGEIASLEEH